MCKMYGIIEELCRERGIKPGKMCADLGISRGVMGDLKAGRTKKLSAENIEKVSRYFGVPSDYLLGTATRSKDGTTLWMCKVFEILHGFGGLTMLQDFLEKFPNATLHDNGTPYCCPHDLGHKKRDKCSLDDCVYCWNRPVEEEDE